MDHPPCPVVVVRDTNDPPRLTTFLAGTDGSDGAGDALRWAASFASSCGRKVVAFHSIPDSTAVPSTHAEIRHAALLALEGEWTTELRRSKVAHQTLLSHGDPRLTIPEVADQVDADLVVVGARGRGQIGPMLLGSVANHLVQHCRRPLAIIPSGWP